MSQSDGTRRLSRRAFLRRATVAGWTVALGSRACTAAESTAAAAPSAKNPAPAWWTRARSLYCPAFCAGAGGALMQYLGPGLRESSGEPRLRSFRELPALLAEARQLGSDVLYLVDYWEGGYFNKGDYLPRQDLGGPETFREGIRAVHKDGGRIIVYLEAFIVSRTTSDLGRRHGADWAIQREDGSYRGYRDAYQEDEQYYLMWPGAGSDWPDALASLGERYLRDYDVDGFHLDSYGYQRAWIDYHPRHPDGRDPKAFDTGATRLVRQFRDRIRRIKPEAVAMLEGNECPWLLPEADGSQAWSLAAIDDKPWAKEHRHTIFTSSRSLTEMERILASGSKVSLAPWWLQPMPDERVLDGLRKFELGRIDGGWAETIAPREALGRLWSCYNVLWANGALKRSDLDLTRFERIIRPWPFPIDAKAWTQEIQAAWSKAVEVVAERLKRLDLGRAQTPAAYLRELVQKAER